MLPPTPGDYEDFVATLDFASLYPSIIMAKNFCFHNCLRLGADFLAGSECRRGRGAPSTG